MEIAKTVFEQHYPIRADCERHKKRRCNKTKQIVPGQTVLGPHNPILAGMGPSCDKIFFRDKSIISGSILVSVNLIPVMVINLQRFRCYPRILQCTTK